METRRERKSRGITQTRQHTELPAFFIDPENQSLWLVLGHDGGRIRHPLGMPPGQKLKRKGGQMNTSQPDHGKAPDDSRPVRAVWLGEPGAYKQNGGRNSVAVRHEPAMKRAIPEKMSCSPSL